MNLQAWRINNDDSMTDIYLFNIYISLVIILKCSVLKIFFIQHVLSAEGKKVLSSNYCVRYQSI